MKVYTSKYEREDGVHMTRCRDISSSWIIGCAYGPMWFWNSEQNGWEIVVHDKDYSHCRVSEEDGLELLSSIKKKWHT